MKHHLFCSNLMLALVLVVSTGNPAGGQKLDTDKLKEMKARSLGPAGMSGRVTCVEAVAGNPSVLYIGTASGGVWKSTSGGTAWKPVFDSEKVLNIGAIAVTQSNPDIVWVGTGEGNPRNSMNLGAGIYKSMDAGRSWTLMGLENTRNIHRIVIDPRDENTVYAGSHGNAWTEHPEKGVYKTTDGGKTWEKILYVDDKTGVADLVMDPSNPNKLIAAMWEYRRWPWYFESGGPGSGLYVTLDAGKTWTKRTAQDGLPEGELGRMGLAIAPSDPQIVYAIIESGKNALYRSKDGGFTWKMVNEGKEIGDRPFYYSDIYVDPGNENRLYSIYSDVGLSEDGGKSFRVIAGTIHSDHHAWWIHPEDPAFILDGNDGGMAISRDRGETWQFMENLPLGQWYHIRVDNEVPYNVYGGLQDNGSWRGPGYVWRSGGIRNEYWQEVMFGDGFDVVPDPDDARYGYAMSQQGNLGRYDCETGLNYAVKPVPPDLNTKLRFNWNAAIEQDPFDRATIYFGSQFLHKSMDRGLTWQIISPDLTTNNPEKQKYGQSGGLTLDVTGAENYTTLLAIAVSPLERGVIWVGTDDGNVQLTRDGGQTWTNHAGKLPGLPGGSWIPQIQASSYHAGEAFVVANNYRMGDFTPYAFRTRDYGATWERIVDDSDVYGYSLCIVQDPVEPGLIFLGTEHGLWVSIDDAETWTQWKNDYPSVSTMDMVIQEREADLVIGTFGRSVFILDDIRPLREIAATRGRILDEKFRVFDPPQAYRIFADQQPSGTHFPGDAVFEGENKPFGYALITYYLKKDMVQGESKPVEKASGKSRKSKSEAISPEKEKTSAIRYDSIRIWIYDGDVRIRTLQYPAHDGLNKVTWRLRKKGVQFPNPWAARYGTGERSAARQAEPAGFPVRPGEYKVVLSCGDRKDSATVTVLGDPRIPLDTSGLAACEKMYDGLCLKAEALNKATARLNESKAVLDKVGAQLKGAGEEDLKSLAKETRALEDSIKLIREYIMGKEETRQGIADFSEPTVATRLFMAARYIQSRPSGPTATEEKLVQQADFVVRKAIDMTNAFFNNTWPAYRQKVENTDFKWFKDYNPIELK